MYSLGNYFLDFLYVPQSKFNHKNKTKNWSVRNKIKTNILLIVLRLTIQKNKSSVTLEVYPDES